MRFLIKSLLLPPFSQIILVIVALILFRRSARTSKILIVASTISLYCLSTPVVSHWLLSGLEQYPALANEKLSAYSAQAIVILTGGQNNHTEEFGRPVSAAEALMRLRYGAYLQQETSLPVLVSGGKLPANSPYSLSETSAFELETLFSITPTWLESRSTTTYENATFSRNILASEHVDKIFLVTTAYHAKRATILFEHAGFDVIPAPTFFMANQPFRPRQLLPTAQALFISSNALHEWLGYCWYRMTLGPPD